MIPKIEVMVKYATMVLMKNGGLKVLSAALYVVPVLFFFSVYFLQVVSSEDLFQGAGRPPAVLYDMSAAFKWNARLGDMYARPVINFFDYKYQFGIDTIFRLVDVAMAVGIFYLMTTIIMGRRPKFAVRDGLIFAISFIAVFLSEYSRSLVSSFSQIHNYLIIALFSLLFLLPFVWQLRGRELANSTRNKIGMLVLGFLFGFASNVTPVTFLITVLVITGYGWIVLKRKISIKRFVRSWQFFAIIGIFVAIVIMYGFGPGFSSYGGASYVSFHDLFSSPLKSGLSLIGNMVKNFQLVTPILIAMALSVLFEYVIAKKRLIVKRREPVPGLYFSAACLLLFFVHILAVSQIDVASLTRILIPAYICAVVSVLFTVNRITGIVELPEKTFMIASLPILLLGTVICGDVTVGMVHHRQQATTVLNRIKNTPGNTACVTQSDNPDAKSPLLKYHQRELFANWMMPATIYGKKVSWCTSS